MSQTNVHAEEIAKFQDFSTDVWDPKGSFRPLHAMNPCRMEFIVSRLCSERGLDRDQVQPLKGLKILDAGCGGGLASEPLARLGAQVTSIDLAQGMVDAGRAHAQQQGLIIDYRCMAIEELDGAFDAVISLEVIEHLPDVTAFLGEIARLVKPEGQVFISTLNRTPQSYAFAIVGAEYIARLLPKGTHDWKMFVKPSELAEKAQEVDLRHRETMGMMMNPLTGRWVLSASRTEINYITLLTTAEGLPTSPPASWGI